MKNIKLFVEFINEEDEKHYAFGEVKGDEVRINAVKNKVYLVNFEKNIEPNERKKLIDHLKEKYGSILTQIAAHLGDLVITFSVYITTAIATEIKDILNDVFTARAELSMEDSKEEEVKEPEGLLDGDSANKKSEK